MLVHSYHFLTGRRPSEVEAAADLYFPALGYRRRHVAPGASAAPLAYERGRRLASFYSPSLRACAAVVEVSIDGGGARDAPESAEPARPAAIRVRHAVQTIGRLVIEEDRALLEAEARAFERFLETGDPGIEHILAAARRHRDRALWLKVAAAAGAALGVAAAIAAALGQVGAE